MWSGRQRVNRAARESWLGCGMEPLISLVFRSKTSSSNYRQAVSRHQCGCQCCGCGRRYALHHAFWHGNTSVVRCLLQDERINVNGRNVWNGTALHVAVQRLWVARALPWPEIEKLMIRTATEILAFGKRVIICDLPMCFASYWKAVSIPMLWIVAEGLPFTFSPP